MTLTELNKATASEAYTFFEQACAASAWIRQMVESRPFASEAAVSESAVSHWSRMSEKDYLEAFDAHPMIGDVSTLRKKFANTQTMASAEQAGTARASEDTLKSLHALNHAYLKRHGFIFIICASGLSAEEMLKALQARIDNNREEEICIAAEQQLAITLLRLKRALSDKDPE